MTKQEYLNKIREGISGIPKNDVEERIAFYSEIINDKIEEGLSEYGAILEIGAADDVVQQILLEYPLSKLVKEKISSIRKMKTSETVLLILTSPLWLSLVIAAFAVIISLFILLLAIVISLWVVFAATAISLVADVIYSIGYIFLEDWRIGLVCLAISFFLAGQTIICFILSKAITKLFLKLTKKLIIGIKKIFI